MAAFWQNYQDMYLKIKAKWGKGSHISSEKKALEESALAI